MSANSTRLLDNGKVRVFLDTHIPGLYLIAIVSGITDAACFLGLGLVFAEMMTGNMVMMAFSIVSDSTPFAGDWTSPWAYAAVLASFAVGAYLAGWGMRKSAVFKEKRHGFIYQWLLMLLAAFMALILDPDGTGIKSILIVSVLAFSMGIQNALIRTHGVPNLATSLMTLTFTGLFADQHRNVRTKMWVRQGLSIVSFIFAAGLGAYLLRYGVAVPLFVAVGVMSIALYWLLTKPAPVAST